MKISLFKKKPLLFPVAICLLLSGLSCKKIDELLTFSINVENNFTVGATGPISVPFEILTPQVTTNSTQQFQNNNSNVNKVKDIKLKQVDLQILSPSGKTFSFLQSVHIYISTNASDEIELAYLDDISSTATAISLIPTTASLDKYVKASSYSLRTRIVTKQALTQDVEIKNLCRFQVTANL